MSEPFLGKLWINRLRLGSESFAPRLRFEKWEILRSRFQRKLVYGYGNVQISLSDFRQPLGILLDQKLGHFTDWSNCHLKLCTGETCKTKIVIQRHSANNGSMFTDFLFHHLRSFFSHLIQAEPDGLADARA